MPITQEDIFYYKKFKTQEQLNEELRYECREGNLEAVQYLLTSPDLKMHPDIKEETENGYHALALALVNGHLKIVKYLLLDEELKNSPYNPPIKYNDLYEGYLDDIAETGNLELLNFVIKEFPLFTEKTLERRCDNMLEICFEYEYLDMIDYLMEYDECGWVNACWNLLCRAEKEKNYKIIDHLIINFEIENLGIANSIMESENYPEMKKVLEKKILAKTMNNELSIKANKKSSKL